jgi:excisionase family DNA binding protein
MKPSRARKTHPEHHAPLATVERLVTQRELSQRLTLSRTTIWRLTRSGALPAPKQITSTRIGWRESDVSAWLAKR